MSETTTIAEGADTSSQERIAAFAVAAKLAERPEVDLHFLCRAIDLALESRGVYHLLELWRDFSGADADEVVADIQDALDDWEDAQQRSGPVVLPKVPYKALDEVGAQIAAYKAKLRNIIEQNGGVSQVARICGIPQPSLSRMLNSGGMPRKSTVYKIAVSLKIPENEIVGEWFR